MEDDSETVADAMNRGYFLAPALIGETEVDPLLQQALRNVDDDVQEAKARAAAEASRAAHDATRTRRSSQKESTPPPRFDPELFRLLVRVIQLLGRKYAAVIAGATKTGVMAGWLRGAGSPAKAGMARLRLTFRLMELLQTRFDDSSIREWFLATNELLGDERPIVLLSFQPASTAEDRLLTAAKATVVSHERKVLH